ncbi:MAG: hypothetical protein K2X39_00895 [Silvanigrellaceae bacterium]|nr:hypothetical protein [Silvanigrellaceae bacterium]
MSSLSNYVNVEELQEIIRLYAHQLLLGYEETHEEEFWMVSEKLAEIYEYLLPFVALSQTKTKEANFPEDYWLLCQQRNLLKMA